ncbi:polysaccharide biosynthesis C-terminal domain-containing protein [Microbacterium sufflavum]|uniref:NAD-dependent epimerase/dehydratase family protein n=1 Tax=Microbacterium sufflavum TaxID=2851649 RepID=A0ABY4IHF0_9MICO|nr:NAD-dependent epimerase/dehydratase family protein [Microbacterium sufflavum]MCK2026495.1 NAD-dependent epimerase/dehydratase family protein [Microbacterium sufflavum]UPL11291.1 NAD-dependent epimerase/dehydratase family protein [Microbacterium sufflavum]
MTRVAVTGARGFLGWHLRAALQEAGATAEAIALGAAFDATAATAAVDGADRVIHVAGVNRATDEEIADGNVGFAGQLASALRAAGDPPPVVVYANSIQAGNGSVYGEAKARAAEILAGAARDIGAEFVDVHLPNLFGEHGRPFYNAVTATFSHLIANGESPTVENDKELTLLHAQNAADVLLGAVPVPVMEGLQRVETVSGVLARLQGYAELYGRGEIPSVADDFDRDLFNTYRSYTFPTQSPIGLTRHADSRGSFFEIIRSHGGPGQSSFSTTVPGVTRGDHFHRRKIERFTVLQGRARISLRRLYSEEVVSFDVSGDAPGAVDMPTMWAHNITNIGDDVLYTSFWTNDIFDPANPDTIAEAV